MDANKEKMQSWNENPENNDSKEIVKENNITTEITQYNEHRNT